MQSQLRLLLRMKHILFSLSGFSLGLLGGVLSNYIYDYDWRWIPWLLLLVAVGSLMGALWGWWRAGQPNIRFGVPRTVRGQAEAELDARRGFVGFVSYYTPQPGSAAAALSAEERERAITELAVDRLDIESSNLQPTISAVLGHATRLEHCWLVATQGTDAPGSLPHAALIVAFLRRRHGLRCAFHYGPEYAIALDDDALVVTRAYSMIRRVFQEAAKLGLRPEDLIADITAGIRSLPLGMILACLERKRDVELMGTHYDAAGRPVRGDLFPMIFDFEPVIQDE